MSEKIGRELNTNETVKFRQEADNKSVVFSIEKLIEGKNSAEEVEVAFTMILEALERESTKVMNKRLPQTVNYTKDTSTNYPFEFEA